MKEIIPAAACLLLLFLAAPASAQSRPDNPTSGAGLDRTREFIVNEMRSRERVMVTQKIVGTREPRLVGAWALDEGVLLGIGVYRVQKVNRNDPNRGNPLRDPTGRSMGVAAVGMSFRF